MKKFSYALLLLALFSGQVLFTTSCKDDDGGSDPNPDPPGDSNTFKDPRDGKVYKTVKIGEQTWFAENLNLDTNTSDSTSYYCYNDSTENCDQDGGLYTWYVAKVACPQGWHLGTKAEWETLIKTVTGQSNIDLAEAAAGILLKKGGSSGFEAALPGSRNMFGSYNGKNERGYYWVINSSDEKSYYANLKGDKESITIGGYGFKSAGLCVRCIEDK